MINPQEIVIGNVHALGFDEDQFVSWILDRLPINPPNYQKIVQLNEKGVFPELDLARLEAGANMCAV